MSSRIPQISNNPFFGYDEETLIVRETYVTDAVLLDVEVQPRRTKLYELMAKINHESEKRSKESPLFKIVARWFKIGSENQIKELLQTSFFEELSTLDQTEAPSDAHEKAVFLQHLTEFVSGLRRLSERPQFKELHKISSVATSLEANFMISPEDEKISRWFRAARQLAKAEDHSALFLFEDDGELGLISRLNKTSEFTTSLSGLKEILDGERGKTALRKMHEIPVCTLHGLFSRLTFNYINSQEITVDSHQKIIQTCYAIQSILQQKLKETPFYFDFSNVLSKISHESSSIQMYPQGFLHTPDRYNVLKSLALDVEIYRQCLSSSIQRVPNNSNFTFIGSEEGLFQVYILQSDNAERLVVRVLPSRLEKMEQHFYPQISKDNPFNLLIHAPVDDYARTLYEKFNLFMEEKKKVAEYAGIENLPITIVAFGLTAAAAQVTLLQWNKYHPNPNPNIAKKDGHIGLFMGMPLYREIDDADQSQLHGFYSLNFVIRKDLLLQSNRISQIAMCKFSDGNCDQFPVFDKVPTFSLTGHILVDYSKNLQASINIPIIFYDHYQAVRHFLEKTSRRAASATEPAAISATEPAAIEEC